MMTAAARDILLASKPEDGLKAYKERAYLKMDARSSADVRFSFFGHNFSSELMYAAAPHLRYPVEHQTAWLDCLKTFKSCPEVS
jgi:hypothetical protein